MKNILLLEINSVIEFQYVVAIVLVVALIAVVCKFVFEWQYKKHLKFVLENSAAISSLKMINSRYTFLDVDNCDMVYYYDNETFFESVTPEDYLTYQLVYCKKKVLSAIKGTRDNHTLFANYSLSVKKAKTFGQFFKDTNGYNLRFLLQLEEESFNSLIEKPIMLFSIKVTLYRTLINGRVVEQKNGVFSASDVEIIINKLAQKRGNYYLDPNIWDSICRVERAKVSNKMRFAIYERDNYRCCICHRRTDDLEIDHIFPISKGGKSVYDNLQTLCHECNTKKSNKVFPGVVNPGQKRGCSTPLCPECKAPMVVRKGKKGEFYGCPNYPECNGIRYL